MKVPFGMPEYDPQITQITRINSRKKAHKAQKISTDYTERIRKRHLHKIYPTGGKSDELLAQLKQELG